MKKLLLSIAVVVACLSGTANAVSDAEILNMIKEGQSDISSLCTKFDSLPVEDKKRLLKISLITRLGSGMYTPVQEQIWTLIHKIPGHTDLLLCIDEYANL